jgi:hypothetical protein
LLITLFSSFLCFRSSAVFPILVLCTPNYLLEGVREYGVTKVFGPKKDEVAGEEETA